MWDKCLYSDCQKEKYADFYFDVYNDDVLTSHEVYLDKLQKFYEDNKWVSKRTLEMTAFWFVDDSFIFAGPYLNCMPLANICG